MGEAIDLYNTILESEPENTVVLSILAIALANVGGQANTEQKAQNYLDRAQDTFLKLSKAKQEEKKRKLKGFLIYLSSICNYTSSMIQLSAANLHIN